MVKGSSGYSGKSTGRTTHVKSTGQAKKMVGGRKAGLK